MTRKSLSWMVLVLVLSLLAMPLLGCNRSAAGDDVAELEEQMSREAAQNTTSASTPEETPAVEPGTSEVTTEPTAAPESGATPEAPVATEQPATQEPVVTPVPVTETPVDTSTPAAVAVPGTHVVQLGENLFRIALRYGISVDELARANNITDVTVISVGQVLIIPRAAAMPTTPEPTGPGADVTVHIVQPGENLFRIALRYGLDYDYLARYNGITDPALVYVGQQIRIPPR